MPIGTNNLDTKTYRTKLKTRIIECISLKGNENTFVLHQFGQNCMLLERIFFVIFLYEKSVPNIRIMFPKSKDFDFLDVPISMSF